MKMIVTIGLVLSLIACMVGSVMASTITVGVTNKGATTLEIGATGNNIYKTIGTEAFVGIAGAIPMFGQDSIKASRETLGAGLNIDVLKATVSSGLTVNYLNKREEFKPGYYVAIAKDISENMFVQVKYAEVFNTCNSDVAGFQIGLGAKF
jgi:hypothetical protein